MTTVSQIAMKITQDKSSSSYKRSSKGTQEDVSALGQMLKQSGNNVRDKDCVNQLAAKLIAGLYDLMSKLH
jgi:hypothetical protein